MLVPNKEIDTCLTRLTWDFQPFLAVTRASGVWHVSHASGLTSECAIYDSVSRLVIPDSMALFHQKTIRYHEFHVMHIRRSWPQPL